MQIAIPSRAASGASLFGKARLSAALLLTSLLVAAGAPSADAASPRANRLTELNIVPTIESIEIVDGQLIASGTASAVVKGKFVTSPFSTPVDIRLAEQANSDFQILQTTCPVLDLELGPINLDLLGLLVETSPICLQITAYQGEGLLGDLLCTVANLLSEGLSLEQILAGQGTANGGIAIAQLSALSPVQINQLLGGLTDLINGVLQNLQDAILESILPSFGRNCPILHLELGPLDLTLLGLEVILDDCDGGPVTVDITAQRGGGLLGNLLCGLLGGLDLLLGQPLSVLTLLLVALI